MQNLREKCKHRLTHGEFRKTCSEKCRRELEGSFKSYQIIHNDEQITLQGYERFVVPDLLRKYSRSDLRIGFENEFIEYNFKGKIKKYLPDVFIKSENKIVEIKSTYSYKLDLEKNLTKRDGCILKGFNFEFQIWDNGKIKVIK